VTAAAIGALVAVPAKADPKPIFVGSPWGLTQKNGYYVNLNLVQNGSILSGSANASHGKFADPVLSGDLTGNGYRSQHSFRNHLAPR
jgi:hypothetical protein